MTSPIGNLLAGLGQGAVQGLQYRDRQRMIEQARQDRLAREEEERRRWEAQQAYQRERDGVADERWKVGNDRQNRMDAVSLLDMGYEDADAVAAPTEREQAAPSALDGLIQGIAGQRVAGGVDVGGRTLVAPGENARQRQDRLRLEQAQDADRRQDGGFAHQLAMQAQQQAFMAEQNRLNRENALALAGMRGQGGAGRLPATLQAKVSNLDAGLQMVGDIEKAVKANPKATGLKGFAPAAILNRAPVEGGADGVGVRAALEAFTGEIRNQRFGGALTPTEAAFAERMLPSEKDDSATVLDKLVQVKNYLWIKRNAMVRGGAGTVDNPVAAAGISAADLWETP